MDLPDRLPFETLARLDPNDIALRAEKHLYPVTIVMATKADGTLRPLARIHPLDVMLYQALVDAAAPAIEEALAPRDVVFGYRQTPENDENPFAGTSTWQQFSERATGALSGGATPYALRSDISGYFLHVDPEELERLLLEAGTSGDVSRDLGEMLRNWKLLGVRGLPQGPPASSPLANLYLTPLDRFLLARDVSFVRYVDDLWAAAESYTEARRLQDDIERHLYPRGMSLAGGKTQVYRRDRALDELQTARHRIAAHRQAIQAGVEAVAAEGYIDDEELPDAADVDVAATIALYEEVMEPFRAGAYPPRLRPALREAYRKFSATRNVHALDDLDKVVLRCPDLTSDAMRYCGYASEADAERAAQVFLQVANRERFHREHEQLQVCRAALLHSARPAEALAEVFAEWTRGSESELVRARSLLAWGYLSPAQDFSVVDEFWRSTDRRWRAYAVVAIQSKDRAQRDVRYANWRGSSRGLDMVIDQVRAGPFSWRKI
jgi:hypothetical protein